jgi:hypothetical protein
MGMTSQDSDGYEKVSSPNRNVEVFYAPPQSLQVGSMSRFA